jgi:hypothetical protein
MWLNHLSLLHDKYAIVSTDKAPNNIVLVCKSHYLPNNSYKPIRCGFVPGFVNCKRGCTQLAAASHKVYQLQAPNNIVLVCKSHYLDCLIKELGIDNSLGNPTYTTIALTKEEILDNHRSILCSFGLIDIICGHLQHWYSITVNPVMVATVKHSPT